MNKLTCCLTLVALVPMLGIAQTPRADLVLINGKVFTADSAKPFVEAVAVRDKLIAAVGTSAEISALAGPNTRRIDLDGRVVVPGFNDAHFHFWPHPEGVSLSFETREPTWEEAQAAIRQAVATAPPGTWIFGSVGRTVVLNEQVTRAALDGLAPQNPVLLRAYYGHGDILNSRAMPLLGIAEDEPDPFGGSYERVPGSRRINGRLWEYAQWSQTRKLASRIPDAKAVEMLRAMADEAVRYGITSMQIFPAVPIDRFAQQLIAAHLPIRVRAIPFSLTTTTGRDSSELLRLEDLQHPGPKITVSGVKWILDGTPIERGAAMRAPYADAAGRRGRLDFPESEVVAIVKQALALNQQLLLHCVGDRTAEIVLETLERMARDVDWKSKRLRIEHGDGVHADLIARAHALGLIVVQNPSHFDPGLVGDRFPKDGGFMPMRTYLESGVRLAIGSDGPMNPFLNIMLASIHPMNPKEAITREQAVRAYTAGSAFAEFAEATKGTLTAGKKADLAVLSEDVFTVATPDLPKLTSLMTLVDGEVVYDARALE